MPQEIRELQAAHEMQEQEQGENPRSRSSKVFVPRWLLSSSTTSTSTVTRSCTRRLFTLFFFHKQSIGSQTAQWEIQRGWSDCYEWEHRFRASRCMDNGASVGTDRSLSVGFFVSTGWWNGLEWGGWELQAVLKSRPPALLVTRCDGRLRPHLLSGGLP